MPDSFTAKSTDGKKLQIIKLGNDLKSTEPA